MEKILIIGDSLTGNYSASSEKPWSEILDGTGKYNIRTITMNGALSSQVLERLCGELAEDDSFTEVWILAGTNDAFSHYGAERILGNLKAAVKKIKSCGMRPLIIVPPGIDTEIVREVFGDSEDDLNKTNMILGELQNLIYKLREEEFTDLKILDFKDKVYEYAGMKDEIFTDGVHFTGKLNRYLADSIS